MMGHESRSNVFAGPVIGSDAAVAAATATVESSVAAASGASDEGKGDDEVSTSASLLGGSALASGSGKIFGYGGGLGDTFM